METKVELKRPKGLPLAVQKKGRSLESYPDAKTKTEESVTPTSQSAWRM